MWLSPYLCVVCTPSIAACALVAVIGASCGGGGDGEEEATNSAIDVAVTWRANEPAVAGYVVHWGTASRTYSHDIDVQMPASDTDGLIMVAIRLDPDDSEPTYFFAITAYGSDGASSGYSNEVLMAANGT